MGSELGIWDIQYQLLKKQFFLFWKRGLRRFGLCTFFLKVSVQIFEKCRPMSSKPINIRLKMTLRDAQSLRFELCLAFFSSCEWQKVLWEVREIIVRELLLLFVRLQCWVSPALVFGKLRLVLWLFTSCVWDVLGCRILIKTAFVSWAKQKLSKTTLSTFKKCPFVLCSTCFFGCN